MFLGFYLLVTNLGGNPKFNDSLIDRPTYQTLDSKYALDKNHVYYWGSIVVGAKPMTFRLSGSGYTTDGAPFFGRTLNWMQILLLFRLFPIM